MNLEGRRGVGYGLAAYLLWGIFPLYFRLLERSGPIEVVAHRVFWSLVLCLIVVGATRGFPQLRRTLTTPRQVGLLAAAAALVTTNWGVYIYAVNSGHVVEASLGYFINPLVTVLLGVVILRERLRVLQWVAVGVGAVAVLVLAVDYGRPPAIALSLAASFGLYGLVKKQVGAQVSALTGLTTETVLIGPIAAAVIVWLQASGRGGLTLDAPWHGLLLASTGVITVIPLLLFAASARRVPLATIGLLQYLTPILQLLCGLLVFHERMAASRWAGFGLVWLALVLLTVDSLRGVRQRARAGAAAAAAAAAGAAAETGAPIDPVPACSAPRA